MAKSSGIMEKPAW